MTASELPSVDVRDVGDDYLLDVREQHEWDAGHAPNAVHVPLSQLQARVAEVPTDRPVSIVCKAGGRSAQATGYLLERGAQVRNVTGGMLAWHEAGLPMRSEGAGEPTVA